MDWQGSIVTASHAEHNEKYSPEIKWGEYVVLNELGKVYSLNSRTTGDRPEEVAAFMAGLNGAEVKDIPTTRTEILGASAERTILTPAELDPFRATAEATDKVAHTAEAGILSGLSNFASGADKVASAVLGKLEEVTLEIIDGVLGGIGGVSAPTPEVISARKADREKAVEDKADRLSQYLKANNEDRAEMMRQDQERERARQEREREGYDKYYGRDR